MSIYQHFRYEEIETVKVLEDLVAQAESQYAPILTHFLDPRQQFILTTLVNRTDLNVSFMVEVAKESVSVHSFIQNTMKYSKKISRSVPLKLNMHRSL